VARGGPLEVEEVAQVDIDVAECGVVDQADDEGRDGGQVAAGGDDEDGAFAGLATS